MDKIFVRDISFYGFHGVLPEEKTRGQEFITTVELSADCHKPALTDKIDDAVDYGQVVDIVKGIITGPSLNLLESLAEKIAEGILKLKDVKETKVTVEKPRPPLPAITGRAGVTVYRKN